MVHAWSSGQRPQHVLRGLSNVPSTAGMYMAEQHSSLCDSAMPASRACQENTRGQCLALHPACFRGAAILDLQECVQGLIQDVCMYLASCLAEGAGGACFGRILPSAVGLVPSQHSSALQMEGALDTLVGAIGALAVVLFVSPAMIIAAIPLMVLYIRVQARLLQPTPDAAHTGTNMVHDSSCQASSWQCSNVSARRKAACLCVGKEREGCWVM